MKLSSFFSKKDSVNLMPKDSFETSLFGRVLEWALVFGKWTVILTQLVVVSAFLMRFGLDRKLTNLRRDIAQQVAHIRSYSQLEDEFVSAQKRVNFVKPVLARQDNTLLVFEKLSKLTPHDVWFERIAFSASSVSLSARSGSIFGFSLFLGAIKDDGFFDSINISSLESVSDQNGLLRFEVTLGFRKESR